MNKSVIFATLLLLGCKGFSQVYEFQTLKDLEATPVISQDATGTCWSFSTTSFLEAEIIRLTGKKIDLSEMYSVRYTYLDKAENYVMRQGKAQFGEGGLSHDVINSARKYGLVPANNYIGKLNSNSKYDHSKMVAELEDIVKKAVAETPKKYSDWKKDYLKVLNNYMGNYDESQLISSKFLLDNNPGNSAQKSISPTQFLATTKLNLDDYVTITSFTNAPLYSKFILSIPDNFANGSFYNLTLDEFIQNIDNAIDKGYTLALDIDVSEATFSGVNGIAVLPENEADSKLILTQIKTEKNITAAYRQSEFENFNTQDDHLMHIVGKVTDQKGSLYYKVKNSWGTAAGKNGYVYISIPYIRLKAISVLLHKDGLLKKTRTSIGI